MQWPHAPTWLSSRLVRWYIFGVVVAIIPIGINWLASDILNPQPAQLFQVLGGGDLALIAGAISAGALGELLGVKAVAAISKIMAGGTCVAVIMLSATIYAMASPNVAPHRLVHVQRVSDISIVLLLIALVAGTACILLSEDAPKQASNDASEQIS